MASIYEDAPIDLAKDAIRLVRLIHGAEGQPIQCLLFQTYLSEADGVPYEALSYVWGSRKAMQTIWINSCQFSVTQNLYNALENLRQPTEDRVLWVDAICIDQGNHAVSDTILPQILHQTIVLALLHEVVPRYADAKKHKERGHQVGQMREVYRNALEVVIWLGMSNNEMDNLFNWMTSLDQRVICLPSPRTINTWKIEWLLLTSLPNGLCRATELIITQALKVLLQRDWFSRIWVLQEAAAARSAWVTCGRKQVRSRTFVAMPSLLGIQCNGDQQARLEIMPGLFRDGSSSSRALDQDLKMLLQKFGRSEASDPRDNIYALIGLCSDCRQSDILQPDYGISLQEAIKRAVAYLLTHSKDLPYDAGTAGLPDWDLTQFLDALQDLPTYTWRWASQKRKYKLLADLLNCQLQEHGETGLRKYLTDMYEHGRVVAISIKQATAALFEKLMDFPEIDVSSPDINGNTPRLMAIIRETLRSTGRPLESLHNLDRIRRRDNIDLAYAVQFRNMILINKVLEHPEVEGCNLNAELNKDGIVSLVAWNEGNKVVELVLSAITRKHLMYGRSIGSLPHQSEVTNDFSPAQWKSLIYDSRELYRAVVENRLDHARKFLDADPEGAQQIQIHHYSPLDTAAALGNTRMVALLLGRGARFISKHKPTPVWRASVQGNIETVKLLVKKGADANESLVGLGINLPAIWAAASESHIAVVLYLLKAGAKVIDIAHVSLPTGKVDHALRTMFWAATSGGHVHVVRALATSDTPANIEAAGIWMMHQDVRRNLVSECASPLWIAASFGRTEAVKLLIQQGAQIDARDTYLGMTPLWRAAHQGKTDVMVFLIQAGADIRRLPLSSSRQQLYDDLELNYSNHFNMQHL